ncbi:c-type cytochrome [Maritimibacter dapengensis]|uniref:Cytochrome C n=1 Tax=Maritimibacter dapengensis TaxID=2836868 RepID=A0ABS6T0J6_9RHOB|nr:cytochrome C [Maritimibacter dapengensis]MBV7378710.1 cytochrome C [Maritimibacter dapengensis]
MKAILTAAAALALTTTAVFAEGDAAAGENDFKKCKSCHAITTADGESIVKGGKTGPNLHGIIGRQAGTVEDFKYGDSIVAAGEAGLVWTEELLVEYAADPKAFLSDYLGESAKSKMTFKLKDASDVAAYLATFSEDAGS